jgi:CheY-like chemotaxis protein
MNMKKILVADDSVTIQKVIALTFADEPFEVQSVGTGAEALEMMNTWKPDILLADVIMPQMNGYELCRAVKEQQETSSVPVLLLAGTFEAFDEEEAKSVGADGYITKPFESVELIEKVNVLAGVKPPVEPPLEPPAGVSQEEVPGEEPLQAEPPRVEPPQAEPPQVEPIGIDTAEIPTESVPEPAQELPEAVPGTQTAESQGEPDIWDILSGADNGEQAPDSGIADAAMPGMGPIEDQGVVDVGSFDVGLDRPEEPTSAAEPQAQADAGIPPVSTEPDLGQPAAEVPAEPAVSQEPAVFPPEQPMEVSPEKSRVEDREKDFFGFETEGLEATGQEDILGDAVEEITFEVEEPAAVPGDEKHEASFVVPEPAENEISITGDTLPPEVLAPEPPKQEEPPVSIEPTPPEEPDSPEFAVSLEEQVPEPVAEETVPLVEDIPAGFVPEPEPPQEPSSPVEEDVGEIPEASVIEPVPEVLAAEPEPAAEPGLGDDLLTVQPAETAPPHISGEPTDAEIRKIVEEKVEKVVWEVVPEMAEVLIREAIEKLKGKP